MVNAKYTILVFWDPDCSHCKKEIPKIKDLYDQVKGKGVQVYAVCTEVEIDKWKKFIREHKLDWINVADPTLQTNFRKIFDITSTPVIYFLDDKKNIVAKKLAYDQVGELLERNLNIKLNIIRDPKDKEKDKAH
jgi:thioredoxin-related protein